jgi:hypothetical protein
MKMDPALQLIMEQFKKMSAELKSDINTSQDKVENSVSAIEEEIKNYITGI